MVRRAQWAGGAGCWIAFCALPAAVLSVAIERWLLGTPNSVDVGHHETSVGFARPLGLFVPASILVVLLSAAFILVAYAAVLWWRILRITGSPEDPGRSN